MAGSGKHSAEKLFVVYDGECNLCIATVARLKELPSRAHLQFVQIQQLEEPGTVSVPGIQKVSTQQLYEKMHVADSNGMLYAGADGVIRVLRTVKGLGALALLYRIPGMRRIADAIYRIIAGRRYEWFGRTEQSCSVDGCEWKPPRQNNNHPERGR
ncbi:DUF393 domain-containing protein [Paenibacillus algorifonticola]|uniref:thiol-disulfide oxidoreductase DCC family protein n=1 Tax=Paenibacillus algorifonticola TaxID=684063 RepID=UPI003D282D4A